MAVPRSGRPATYEDLLAVPEHLVAEIIDGELYTSTVVVFEREGGRWVLAFTAGGAETIPLPPFDVLPLDLTLLWEVPEPERLTIDVLFL